MTLDLWLAFALFAFVGAGTPGPNNLILLASGLQVGVRRTLPFVVGINLGFSGLLVAAGLGLAQLFIAVPEAQLGLQLAGTAYMLWLALGLLRAGGEVGGGSQALFGVWRGAAFQFVNPKAWILAIAAISIYLPVQAGPAALALMCVTVWLVGSPANIAWAWAGQRLQALLGSPRRLRLFNGVMAALLVLSILPVWLGSPAG
jgi:threonine/homoserine/homoserine lactone efflux protein